MKQQEMIDCVLNFIKSDDESEEAFQTLAIQLFRYQFENNHAFQRYCRKKGKTLRTVKTWRDIPAVPVDAFKDLPLTSVDVKEAESIFMTSGSTTGIRGKHYHPSLQVYNTSMLVHFKRCFMREKEKIRMGILFPKREEMPNSSLAHYLALAVEHFGTEKSRYFVTNEGIRTTSLIAELEAVEESGEPYALLGASYSFVHLFEELERLGKSFKLPAGSKLFDTGGFKNQSQSLDLEEFYSRMHHVFGVERKDCINMYGMTELSTQFYDAGNDKLPSVKFGPHWIRTRVIHPLTGEAMPLGEKGILVHTDLANFNSATTIMTEDIGVETENGFLLLGRAEGTDAKGCSLAVEEFMQANKGSR